MVKMLLGGCLLLNAVVGFAQATAKAPQFDVVSFKLDDSGQQHGILQVFPEGDRIVVRNAPLFRIVEFAFGFDFNDLVVGAPDWTRAKRWDMEAKVASPDVPAFRALSLSQQKAMLQQVLLERCRLQAHIDKKERPVYELKVTKSGSKMHSLAPGEPRSEVRDASGKIVDEWDLTMKPGEAHGRAVPMDALLYVLNAASVGRKVVDRTGLKGEYNFDLMWTPEDELQTPKTNATDIGIATAAQPSIFTAVEEQLGLKMVPGQAPVDVLTIEHIEPPTND